MRKVPDGVALLWRHHWAAPSTSHVDLLGILAVHAQIIRTHRFRHCLLTLSQLHQHTLLEKMIYHCYWCQRTVQVRQSGNRRQTGVLYLTNRCTTHSKYISCRLPVSHCILPCLCLSHSLLLSRCQSCFAIHSP